jgi:predicted nucleotidyltransferase
LKDLLEKNPECNVIFLGRQGSFLYGTNTPESDLDIKGIFIPSKILMYKGKVPNTIQNDKKEKGVKNTKDDIDIQLFSIQYFFKLAMEGQTVAIDMLNTNSENVLETSFEWDLLQGVRKIFYCKNMKAFIGYAKSQAIRYALKGSRITSLKKCLKLLTEYPPYLKLNFLWEVLPEDEHSGYIESSPNGMRQYKICGKILHENMNIGSAIEFLEKQISKYGERALKSENNEGIDWKSISHALRAAFELQELFTKGNITFPLKNAEVLLAVKLGLVPYKDVITGLELAIENVQELSENSIFPDNVDKEKRENILVKIIKSYFKEL